MSEQNASIIVKICQGEHSVEIVYESDDDAAHGLQALSESVLAYGVPALVHMLVRQHNKAEVPSE